MRKKLIALCLAGMMITQPVLAGEVMVTDDIVIDATADAEIMENQQEEPETVEDIQDEIIPNEEETNVYFEEDIIEDTSTDILADEDITVNTDVEEAEEENILVGAEEGESYAEVDPESFELVGPYNDTIPYVRIEKTDARVNERLPFTVETSMETRADSVRVWMDEWRDWMWYDSDEINGEGVVCDEIAWGSEGIHLLYAEATYDSGETWERSEGLTVNVTKDGQVGEFTATLSENSVERGEPIDVTYSESTNADEYWVDVEKWNESESEWEGFDTRGENARTQEADTVQLTTMQFAPGNYRLIGIACGVGYEGRDAENGYQEFTITETTNTSVRLSITKNEIETRENFEFTVFAPGAEHIEVYPDYDDGTDWNRYGDGDYYNAGHSYGHSGVYKMVARAFYENGDTDDSEARFVTVTAPKGELNIELPELPDYIKKGEGLSFVAVKPENADEINVNVWADQEEGGIYDEWSTGNIRVNISADALSKVKRDYIKLSVDAEGKGYDSARKEVVIPIIETSEEVSVSVAKTQAKVNENVEIVVSTSEKAKKIRVWMDDNQDWLWNREFEGDDLNSDGSLTVSPSWGNSGKHTVYAQAMFEDEWISSKPVSINITSEGRVGDFTLTLDKTSVSRGETFTATYSESENADSYWLDFDKWNGAEWEWFDHMADSTTAGDVTVSTAMFEPGEYRVIAQSCGYGYEGTQNSNGPIDFTVADSEMQKGDVVLSVSKNELITEEGFEFSVFAPEAVRVEVYPDMNNQNWVRMCDGEWYRDGNSYNENGTYQMIAKAYYQDESVVTTAPETINVTAPNGRIAVNLPELPVYLSKGDTLSFTVSKPENAEYLRVDIGCDTENGYRELYFKETMSNTLDVNVPASILNTLPDEADIGVNVEAGAYGYNAGHDWKGLPFLNPPENVSITADSKYVLLDEESTVTIHSDTPIKKAQIWENGGLWGEYDDDFNPIQYDEFESDENGNIVIHPYTGSLGTRKVYARISFDGNTWTTTGAVEIEVCEITEQEKKDADQLKKDMDNLTDATKIADAKNKIENLTKGQKAYLASDIANMQNKIKKAEDDLKKAEEKTKADKEAADKVVKLLKSLNEKAGINDEKAVNDAEKAYNSLTNDQKKYVPQTLIEKLNKAKVSVKNAKKEKENEETKKTNAKNKADLAAKKALALSEAAKKNPTQANVKMAQDAVKEAKTAIQQAKAIGANISGAETNIKTAETNIKNAEDSIAKANENANKKKKTKITFGNKKVKKSLNKNRTKTKRITLKKGKKLKLNAKTSDRSKITYKSNKKKVATVSSKGVIKGKKKGKATITVTAGNTKVKILIKVVN